MDKIDEIVETLNEMIDPTDPQSSIDELMSGYEGEDPEAMRAIIEFLVFQEEK